MYHDIMRNKAKLIGIIAIAACIGFTLMSCNDPLDDQTPHDPQLTLQSIAVTTQPTKTQYNLNENLNTAGMIVTAYYSDGSSKPVTDYTTSGFSSTTAGSKIVTVSYGGKTTDFTVTINGQVVNPDPDAILHTKWPFKVGAAAPNSAFTTTNGQYPLLKQFNVLVAENVMKPAEVMPWNKPNTFPNTPLAASDYRWTNADTLVNYAKANNTAIRGHVLIWHSQTPDWWYMDASNNLIGKTELYARMENHIKIMFQKYKGDILWWDVVNEVVAEGGGPRAPRPAGDTDTSKSYYTQIMQDAGLTGFNRYEFVLRAFQYARQYADANSGTNVKLYLTDYNTEYSGAKQTEFLGLLDYLIQNNAPIDGVGFQSHIQYDWPSVNDISTAIDLVTAKTKSGGVRLTAQVCELDMTLFKWNGESTKATLTTAEYDERIALQTAKYRALFEMFLQKYNQNKLDMVLVWGLADGESWLNDRVNHTRVDYPLLFDRQYKPKAAYNELVR
jgi:endo-1,4-beta-xylanase